MLVYSLQLTSKVKKLNCESDPFFFFRCAIRHFTFFCFVFKLTQLTGYSLRLIIPAELAQR